MKKIITLFAFLTSATLLAQGPVIEGTYFPVRNTAIKQVWDTVGGLAVPSVGANQVWDYTHGNGQFLNDKDTVLSKFVDPNQTPYKQYFPNANQATFIRTPLISVGDSLFYYFKVTPQGTYVQGGFSIKKQFDSTMIHSKEELYVPFYLSYGNTFIDTARYTFYAKKYNYLNNFYGARMKSRKTKTESYAGYGTLKLPNATYNNVAMVKEIYYIKDSISVDWLNNGNYAYLVTSVSQGINYHFYRNNTFGSAYLGFLNANTANNHIYYAWYTLPINIGSITGSVYTNSLETTPVTSGEAYLYREYSNFAKNDILAKAQLDASGNYKFDSIPWGEYRIAIRPNETNYPNSMITYYGDTTNWIDASTILTTTLTSPGHKIHLQYHQAPAGTNSIHGNIKLDLGMQRSSEANNFMSSNPIPGVGIVVKRNPGSSTARTLVTDSNGDYDLGTLENGAYVMFVDIPGMHMTGTYSFNVSGTSSITGLDYTAGTDSIHPNNLTIGIKELKNSAGGFMSAYPNPYSNNVSIALNLPQTDNMTLEVFNILGEKIQTLDKGVKQSGIYTYNFSAKKLNYSSGIYFVKLTVGNKTDVIKLIEE